MALVSAQRVQTLHKLRIDRMGMKTEGITFYVYDLLKQSRPGVLGCKFQLILQIKDIV